jgi:hypothetical protein
VYQQLNEHNIFDKEKRDKNKGDLFATVATQLAESEPFRGLVVMAKTLQNHVAQAMKDWRVDEKQKLMREKWTKGLVDGVDDDDDDDNSACNTVDMIGRLLNQFVRQEDSAKSKKDAIKKGKGDLGDARDAAHSVVTSYGLGRSSISGDDESDGSSPTTSPGSSSSKEPPKKKARHTVSAPDDQAFFAMASE